MTPAPQKVALVTGAARGIGLAVAKRFLEEGWRVALVGRRSESLEQTVAARTSELRDIVGELEAFSYSLSHDLRAPLRAIQAFSSIVLEEHAKDLGHAGADMLQKVLQAAKRMEQLIQGVLGFTRVSRQDMKFQTVDIDKLVHELVEERPEFKPADITIASPLLPMRGDIASLTQCISNLVSNAVKFIAPGAPVRVRIFTEAMDDEVRLCVADQGIGIDSEAQRKLFQLFQRQHSSSNYEGSGIGLAIVRKAAERMGGTVGVRSEPGQGSTFWLQLRRG